MRIRFHEAAQQEVDDAVAWYDEREEVLGRDFLDELDRVIRYRSSIGRAFLVLRVFYQAIQRIIWRAVPRQRPFSAKRTAVDRA